MSLKRILITGGSSELMQHVIELFNLNSSQITCITRDPKKFSNNNIIVIKGSINDPVILNKLISETDIIIHAAAVTHSKNEAEYYNVNLKSTKIIADLSKKHQIEKLVLISSRTAHLDAGGYGKSKILSEQYIQKKCDNWLILRPSEIFGGTKNEGINTLINDAFTKKIILYPAQVNYKLYPIYIADVAKIIIDLTHKEKNKTIILNGSMGYSYKEIINLICIANDKKVLTFPIPKMLMFFLQFILKTLPIKSNIVPDQISRLYAPKEVQFLDYKLLELNDYIINRINADKV